MRNGFSFIEILVYIGILAVLISAFSYFFLEVNRARVKTTTMREVLDNARQAMEIMTYEIRGARGVYAPTSVFNVDSGQLSLETEKDSPAGENKTYVDFYLCEKRLCLKKEGQEPIALTSDKAEVKKLQFSQISSASDFPSVQINLKVDYKTSSVDLISTASLRSY